MITLLRIAGFALIDEVELALGPGLTVLTGETGAGKSIIIEALGLLRGNRASTEVIRTGSDEARVEAVFEVPVDSVVRGRLAEDGRDLEPAGEGKAELVARRTVGRNGRGRVHLGGGLATAGDLAASVGRLVDITSQHDQQTLTDPENQLAILDDFAAHRALREEMALAAAAVAEAKRELDVFDADARTRAEREDLLRYQLSELESAGIADADEDARLKTERERLRGAERFQSALSHGEDALYAGEHAVAGQLAGVSRELAGLAALDPVLAPLVERLRDAQAQVEDAARELGRYGQGIRSDPARLNEVEERLFLLGRLARKHGGTLADVIARTAQMRTEIAEIAAFDDGIESRRRTFEAAAARARAAAEALSASRRAAADGLEQKVNRGLAELALGSARLPVTVEPRATDPPGPQGVDRVRFLFAPNPGEPPRPLAKIASGGELSRVMLAMKQALARSDQVTTYVFDEVDSGVGGAVAETIGRKLKAIAADRQVIAITHLPQIAVFADAHLRVSKTVKDGRTLVAIETLDQKKRSAEVARMLSGSTPTKQATAHADDLLRRARVATLDN